MNLRKFETMLRGLKRPAVPEGLRGKLLRNIPPGFTAVPHRGVLKGGNIMKISLAGSAAAIVIGLVLFLGIQTQSVTPAFALEAVLETLERANGIHIVGALRSRAGEPFNFIALEAPLQEVEVWIDIGPHGPGRMRMEKSDRTICFDGEKTLFFSSRTNEVREFPGGVIAGNFLDPEHWLRAIMDRDPETFQVETRYDAGGREVHATVREKGIPVVGRVPTFWGEFDRRTEIRWDRASKRLLDLRRYVETGKNEVLVGEIRSVEYLDRLDDGIFEIDLPSDVRRIEIQDAGDEYSRMGPKEVALAFWEAAITGDWDRVRIFCPSPALIDSLRENPPAEVLSLGDPFRTGGYIGWYVPYEVRYRAGNIVRHNLALRNDNAYGRYVFDGGI